MDRSSIKPPGSLDPTGKKLYKQIGREVEKNGLDVPVLSSILAQWINDYLEVQSQSRYMKKVIKRLNRYRGKDFKAKQKETNDICEELRFSRNELVMQMNETFDITEEDLKKIGIQFQIDRLKKI